MHCTSPDIRSNARGCGTRCVTASQAIPMTRLSRTITMHRCEDAASRAHLTNRGTNSSNVVSGVPSSSCTHRHRHRHRNSATAGNSGVGQGGKRCHPRFILARIPQHDSRFRPTSSAGQGPLRQPTSGVPVSDPKAGVRGKTRQNQDMRVWTVQPRAVIEELARTGFLVGDWKYVEPSWRPAYRVMTDEMLRRGIEPRRNSRSRRVFPCCEAAGFAAADRSTRCGVWTTEIA